MHQGQSPAFGGRLREIRAERFGEHGRAEVARRLGLPCQTWSNYEEGVVIPGQLLLGFLVITGAEPYWLLCGEGPKYRASTPGGAFGWREEGGWKKSGSTS